GATLLLTAWGNLRGAFATELEPIAALKKSPLIYLSPILSNGRQSRCHAEVWFVHQDEEIFIVTWADKWKAKAMRRGLQRARIWIGDFGPWRSANERYLAAPSLEIEGDFETDPKMHTALVEKFAIKYKSEWRTWDKIVKDGLAKGEWVLLRYRISA
ncbi:MAG: hypothetical protein AAF387_14310, partial [Pseudomonadota bacterium]